jgi:hypothetical protein
MTYKSEPTIIHMPLIVSGGSQEIVVNGDGSVTMPEGMTCGEALFITASIVTGAYHNNFPDYPFYTDLIAKWPGFFAVAKPIEEAGQ